MPHAKTRRLRGEEVPDVFALSSVKVGETRRLDKARRAEVAHFPRDVERNAEALTIIVPIKAKGDAYFTG